MPWDRGHSRVGLGSGAGLTERYFFTSREILLQSILEKRGKRNKKRKELTFDFEKKESDIFLVKWFEGRLFLSKTQLNGIIIKCNTVQTRTFLG